MSQPMLDREARLASARNRSQSFWILADFVLKGPQADAWHLLRHASTGAAPHDDDSWTDLAEAAHALDESAWQSLAVEHTRLFAGLSEGTGPRPPFESSWREGFEAGVMQAQVKRDYADAGFADIDLAAGPQDHLAVELKFMALLAFREAQALAKGDAAEAALRMQQQQNFLDRHLLAWVPGWADALAQHTQERVYWALARLLLVELNRTSEEFS